MSDGTIEKRSETRDDLFAILKIHLPLDRDVTKSRRSDCMNAIRTQSMKFLAAGISNALLTDHNTHGRIPEWGGRALYPHGLDYIGYARATNGATVRVLKRKEINGTIDGHDFIAARVLIKWPSGRMLKVWLVQANLGRGVPPEVFKQNAVRIKRAVRGHFIIGLDEIDEADLPNEHEMLETIWNPDREHFCGWSTYSPVIVSRRLRVKSVEVTKACEGLTKVTPHRDLVSVTVAPPKRWRDRFKR